MCAVLLESGSEVLQVQGGCRVMVADGWLTGDDAQLQLCMPILHCSCGVSFGDLCVKRDSCVERASAEGVLMHAMHFWTTREVAEREQD
jgi:hypothetical protein